MRRGPRSPSRSSRCPPARRFSTTTKPAGASNRYNLRLAQVQKQLEDRLAAIECSSRTRAWSSSSARSSRLKSDVARLRGQIEVLNNEQEQTQKRQRDLYIDLDSRLRRLEGGPGANVPPAAGSAAATGRRNHRAPGAASPAPAAGRAGGASVADAAASSSAPTTLRSISSRPATIPPPSRASTRS